MQRPAIIFDLDGTLVDTAPDLINTLNHMLRLEGLAPAPESEIRPMISEGARAMLRHGLSLAGEQRDETQLEELTQRFVAHYSDHIAVDSRPFPGLVKVLDRLRDSGCPLGVCTNKRESLSKKLLAELQLAPYFEAVIGIDTLEVCKPHPGHLLGTLEAVGASARHAAMIGDSETDIRTAQAAGVPVVALTFGYSRSPVHEFHPDATVTHYDQMLNVLASLLPSLETEFS